MKPEIKSTAYNIQQRKKILKVNPNNRHSISSKEDVDKHNNKLKTSTVQMGNSNCVLPTNYTDNKEELTVTFQDKDLIITSEMIDVRIEAKEGFDVAMNGRDFVILDTTLTEELLLEGMAREVVSKLQNMRKEMDLDIQDHINVLYSGSEKIKECFTKYENFIKQETLADSLSLESTDSHFDINGEDCTLSITSAE